MEDTHSSAAAAALVPSLALVIVPDPDAQVPVDAPVLGRPLVLRLCEAAKAAGFDGIYAAPGTSDTLASFPGISRGEPGGGGALVAYETAVLDPGLLELMVRHPLEAGERFSLYDVAGRPTAWFTGSLSAMPTHLPVSEELELPKDLDASCIGRLVYPEDLPRLETLVRERHGVELDLKVPWHRLVTQSLLRRLSNARNPVEQLELLALGLAATGGVLAILPIYPALILALGCLVASVQTSSVLPAVRRLRGLAPSADGLAAATRSLAHAALTAALTYRLIAETDRSNVAQLVLLGLGGAAAVLPVLSARATLHGSEDHAFQLPDVGTLARRLGVRAPTWSAGAPWLELVAAGSALFGAPELPWSVLVVAGLARVWRWFAQPNRGSEASPTAAEASESDTSSRA